jgi:pimeloyl-ACP methyl ester carboxylesterase
MSAGKTFVLIHGGFHGGWCWREVARGLRARGHEVFTPTQTGLGERSHLLSKNITLDTFIEDITQVMRFEDLQDVILVGHSFGGNSVSGVADRMPERIRLLVYLDAIMLEGGQSMFDSLPKEVVATRLKAAEASGGLSVAPPAAAAFNIDNPKQAREVDARLTPHPLGTYTSPLNLAHPVGNGLPAVYVRCAQLLVATLQPAREWVKANGMRTVDIKTGHDAMISAPGLLTDLLCELAV